MAGERGGGLGEGAALLGDGRGGDSLAIAEEVLAGRLFEEVETGPVEVDPRGGGAALRDLAVAALQALAVPEELGVAVEGLGGGPSKEVPLEEIEVTIGDPDAGPEVERLERLDPPLDGVEARVPGVAEADRKIGVLPVERVETRFEADAEPFEIGVPIKGAFQGGPERPEVLDWRGELPA
jgi:hypothetical protein